jgi:hypothetical protein
MQKFMMYVKRIGALIVIIGLAILAFLLFSHKSEGYRVGVPMKISKKGVVFKTYEGEMNLGGLTSSAQGAIPTTWEYTVRHSADSVLAKIDNAIVRGERVKLYYREKFVTFPWWGDTKYFVFDVEPVK